MKYFYTLSLATCTLTLLASIGSSSIATAATNSGVVESEKALTNLTPADELQNVTNEDADTSNEQTFAGPWGGGHRGGGHHGGGGYRPAPGGGGYHPVPRPMPAPAPYYPRPVPRPVPRPYPVPVPRYPYPRPSYPYPVPAPAPAFVSCYARSNANGLTYYGSAYNSIDAQNIALQACLNATGYECIALGCQY